MSNNVNYTYSNKEDLYAAVKVSPKHSFVFILLEELKYDKYIVPKGFITDGASVPRIFWSFFPPNRTDYMPAVILHDYLTDQGLYEEADKVFDEILDFLEVGLWTRNWLVGSVKLYHKIKYDTEW